MHTTRYAPTLVTLLLAFFTYPAYPQTISNQTVTAIDPRVTYIGDWVDQENGGHVFTSVSGSFALGFYGTAVYWYSRMLYDGAVAAVRLDDDDVVYIDLSEGVGQNDTRAVTVLFEKQDLDINEGHRLNVSWNGPGSNGVGSFLENYRILFTGNGSDPSVSSSTSSSIPISSSTIPSSSNTSKTNVGAIVGGIVGGVCGVLIGVLALICLWRRRTRVAGAEDMHSATPFLLVQGPGHPGNSSLSSSPSSKPPPNGRHAPGQREDSRLFISANTTRPPTLLSPGMDPPRVSLPLRAQNSRFTFLPSWYRPRSESSSQFQGAQQDSSTSGREFLSFNGPSTLFPPSPGITDSREAIHDPPPVYRG